MGWLERAGLSIDFIGKQIFVPGGAFRWPQKLNGNVTKSRYFFVLNISPDSDEVVILVTPTTEIKKTYRCNFYGDIVKISMSDYSSLEKECVVNCSSPFKYSREQILQAIEKQEVELLPPIPSDLLKTLRDSLVQSIKVSDEIKSLVLEEESGCDTMNTPD